MKQLLTSLTLLCALGTYAQTVLPLSKLNASASFVHSVYNNTPYNNYKNSSGIKFQVGTNILNGEVFIAGTTFKNTHPTFTNYQTGLFTFGYAYNLPIIKNIWLKPHAGFGVNYMMFEQSSNTNSSNLRESELMYELGIAIQAKIYKKLQVKLGTTYNITQTYYKQQQVFLQAGLIYYFDSPKWIKSFIN